MSNYSICFSKLLENLGLIKLLHSWKRNKITILMLHGVMDQSIQQSEWQPLRPFHSPQQLERTLKVLSNYYNFVSLEDATAMLLGKKSITPNSLVLTFDDGYKNSIDFGLPVLRKFNAPATVFISTGYITSQQPFWVDRFDYAVQSFGEKCLDMRLKIQELDSLDFSSRRDLRKSFISFIRQQKQIHTDDLSLLEFIKNITIRIEKLSGKSLLDHYADDPWSRILTWDEVKNNSSRVNFGSHGVDHLRLTRVGEEIALREIFASREIIEFYTGEPCRHFAYPNGDFNTKVANLIRSAGYVSALTTVKGMNSPGASNLCALCRFPFTRTSPYDQLLSILTKKQ